jgi:biopolymer transport protein ExbD
VRGRFGRDREDERSLNVALPRIETSINITPLIDVLMVLLIIFMLVGLTVERGIDASLPSPPRSEAPNPPPAVRLAIEEGPTYLLDQRPVPGLGALREALRGIYASRSDHTLFVTASGKVPYGRVVEAIDVAKEAGAERFGLVSDPARAEKR